MPCRNLSISSFFIGQMDALLRDIYTESISWFLCPSLPVSWAEDPDTTRLPLLEVKLSLG